MRKKLRKLIREHINYLFEDDSTMALSTPEQKKKDLEDVKSDIEREDKLIDLTNKEEEVAQSNLTNIQKTKNNIADVDREVEALKKTTATKEEAKYKKIKKEKEELRQDLESEKVEDEKKMRDINNMETSEVSVESEITSDTPDTPITPETPNVP